MGAHLDKTGRIYFLREHLERELPSAGATVGDYPEDLPLINNKLSTSKTRPSWSVCRHLSSPERLLHYFQASGSIMVLLGKCICHDCYEEILSQRGLDEYMQSSDHMTDMGFQNNFIEQLFKINRQVRETEEATANKTLPQSAWKVCPHVSDTQILQRLYAGLSPIFFQAGFLSCDACNYAIPTGSDTRQSVSNWEDMTDEELQKKVINKLYPLNRKVLKAFGLCR